MSCPQMVRLVGAHKWGGQEAAHPFTSLWMNHVLARASSQFVTTQHQPLPLDQWRNSVKMVLLQKGNCWDGGKVSLCVDL